MPTVDNKIHFVWVGGKIPEEKVDLILEHLITNSPDYEVFLWTDRLFENSWVFWKTVNGGSADEADEASVSWWELGYYRRTLTFGGKSTIRKAQGSSPALKGRIAGPPKRLTFVDISGIDAELGTLTARYQSAIKTRNYGRASDILRLGIISKEGGIYMDTDVTVLKKLPVNLTAPKGLLIGHGQGYFPDALTNAVVAAPKNSPIVSKLMGAISGQFNRYDRNKWWALVERYRKDTSKLLTKAEATNDTTSINSAANKFQHAMESGTNAVTGPEAVVMFLYFYLVGDNLKNLDKAKLDLLSKLNEATNPIDYLDLLRHAQLHIFKPELKKSGMFDRIAFPKGFLKNESEASWIKNARI